MISIVFRFYSVAIPFNRPKFSPCATWNPNAITFADNRTIGIKPDDTFVDNNNTVYVTATSFDRVVIWDEGNTTPTRTIFGSLKSPRCVFVTSNGDIYVHNDLNNGRIDRWTSNGTNRTTILYVNKQCYSLFVAHNDNIYCSLGSQHRVVRKPLNDSTNNTITVAGNGSKGSASNTLNDPRGIFVDDSLNLYVADCKNNRVQFFPSGQMNGTTVVGTGSNQTISLNCPLGIVLDADKYLFLVDCFHDRIIGSGPHGFRCIAGCSNGSGSNSNQLNHPRMMHFDSYGNIFVTDNYNNRTQKFLLQSNSCSK